MHAQKHLKPNFLNVKVRRCAHHWQTYLHCTPTSVRKGLILHTRTSPCQSATAVAPASPPVARWRSAGTEAAPTSLALTVCPRCAAPRGWCVCNSPARRRRCPGCNERDSMRHESTRSRKQKIIRRERRGDFVSFFFSLFFVTSFIFLFGDLKGFIRTHPPSPPQPALLGIPLHSHVS